MNNNRTFAEAAEATGYMEQTLRRLARCRVIVAFAVDGREVIPASEVSKLQAAKAREAQRSEV